MFWQWTFVRWFGLQEPASAFFSLFNFLSHLIAWRLYVRTVMQLKPGLLSTSSASAQQSSLNRLIETLVRPIDPMFWMHCVNAFFALNAWMWSTTFHAKETNFTEVIFHDKKDESLVLFLINLKFA